MTGRARTLIQFERLKAQCLRDEPLTDEDRREHQILIARQRARDELRRMPVPQLELENVA